MGNKMSPADIWPAPERSEVHSQQTLSNRGSIYEKLTVDNLSNVHSKIVWEVFPRNFCCKAPFKVDVFDSITT